MTSPRRLLAMTSAAVGALLLATPAYATFPGTNGRIAYTNQTGPSVIQTVEPDGSDVQTLTQDSGSEQDPAWSPDGGRIAFSRDGDIWVMDGDGSDREQLTDDAANENQPTWSPDGSRIAFVRRLGSPDLQLFVMDADGSDAEQITFDTDFDNAYSPDWSPDGSRIAFTGRDAGSADDTLWTIGPDGSGRDEIADMGSEGTYDPSWEPNGDRVTFISCPSVDCVVYHVGAEGGTPDAISQESDDLRMPTWSPDGTRLAVHDDDRDLALIDPDGTDLDPVLEDDEFRGDMQWQALQPPAVTTGDATDVTTTSATLNGVVDRAVDATYRFEYGPTTDYGASTPDVALDGTTDDEPVSAILASLQPGTTYHYRLVATNDAGTTAGADRTFTTAAATPPPEQPQACPPGTVGVAPQCVAIIAKEPAKLSLLRATIDRRDRTISILAPITRRASGSVRVRLHAAGRFKRFTAPIDTAKGRVRVVRRIPRAQARLGTGILTIRYAGDADTRPQTVRSRAANNRAQLTVRRPQIVGDRLQVSGTVNPLARGYVRVILQYQVGNDVVNRRRKARIRIGGQWGINSRLAQRVFDGFAQRIGTVHSYTQFTGYFKRRIRGEQRSLQVMGPP